MLLLLSALLLAIVIRWISLERWHGSMTAERATEPSIDLEPTPGPTPTPTKPPVITGRLETARLFNGLTFHGTVEPIPGRAASEERADPESYVVDLKVRTRVPTPNRTMDELAKVTPQLGKLLPGLAAMIKPDSVSPYFAELYETKVKSLRENVGRLDQLMSRHNFYDCQTALHFQHGESHRKAVLLQADMDVDADGSDADRIPAGNGASPNFKPFTSYKWPKKTAAPNPYLGPTEERLKRYETELAVKTTAPERKRDLKAGIAQARDEIGTMKKFSFLIGATDPYIVLPGRFSPGDGAKVGDYAVVVCGDAIYPAIVGDVGPPDKVGEASLRIAKEINSAATPNNRPVSDLKVSYIVFPGTAEIPFGSPDLEKLAVRCDALVKEIGGASVPLHHWENIIPPPPTPTPSPTSTATPSPSETASPTVTPASPSPSSTFAFPTPTPSAGTR